MSFTAKLLNAVKRDSGWKLTIEFTDGADVRTESFRFTGTTNRQLKSFIRSEAEKLAVIKTSDFSAHIGKELDLTPDPVVVTPPTAEKIAKADWFKDLHKLDRLIHLANNGLIQSDDSRITSLQTSLKSDWLNSYLGDI